MSVCDAHPAAHPAPSARSRRTSLWPGVLALTVSLAALTVRMLYPPTGIDYRVYRGAGAAMRDHANLYADAFTHQYGGGLPFTYPPVSAALATPLTWIPETPGFLAWTVANLLLLAAGLRWWLPQASRRTLLVVLAAAIWFTPVTDTLLLGQLGIIIAVGVWWDATRTGRTAGWAVGLLAAVKLVPGLFIIWFLLRRDWRRAGWATGGFLAGTGIGFLADPAGSRAFWSGLAGNAQRTTSDLGFYANQSLLGLTERAGANTLYPLLALTVLAAWAVVSYRAARTDATVRLGVPLTGLVSVLVSPVSWQHHAIWLVPAVLLLWGERTTGWWRGALAAGIAGIYLRLPQLASHTDMPVLTMTAGNWTCWTVLATALMLGRVLATRTVAPAPAVTVH